MKTIFKILVTSAILSLVWLFFSCGARHVKKEQSKEETRTEQADNSVIEKQTDTNVKKTVETKTDDKDEIKINEIIYEFSDTGTLGQNDINEESQKVIRKIIRQYSQKNNTQASSGTTTNEVKKEVEKEQKAVINTSVSKKENKLKEAVKESFKWYNLLWFIIPIGIIYYFYRRYKFF